MSAGTSIGAVLRWRLARAAAEAPPPPSAAQLLAGARPWWDAWPARWQAAVERLGRMQVAYGHAMTTSDPRPGGYPVPALLVGAGDAEVLVRVLYLSVRDGELRLRFLLPGAALPTAGDLEVTFVADGEPAEAASSLRPLLAAHATRAAANEYRLDAVLPQALAHGWAALKVTDRMPFRLVLRPLADGPHDEGSHDEG